MDPCEAASIQYEPRVGPLRGLTLTGSHLALAHMAVPMLLLLDRCDAITAAGEQYADICDKFGMQARVALYNDNRTERQHENVVAAILLEAPRRACQSRIERVGAQRALDALIAERFVPLCLGASALSAIAAVFQ